MTSDDQASSEASRSDSDASSDSGFENGHGFIDDEAEESDSWAFDTVDTVDSSPQVSFPQFMKLPADLRRQVWQAFCADLLVRPRALCFTVSPSSAIMRRPDDYSVKDHWSLADSTEELRIMMATHRESRSIALGLFPDKLRMDAGSGDAVVWFNRERDVVIVHDFMTCKTYHLPGFAEELHQVAIYPAAGELVTNDIRVLRATAIFRNLTRLYFCLDHRSLVQRKMRWCGTDYVHSCMVKTYQKEFELGEDTEVLYCWPNVDRHPDFARYSIPSICRVSQEVMESIQAATDARAEVLPMVVFEYEHGIAEWEELRAMKDTPVLDDGSEGDDDEEGSDEDESQEETDLDEYESEGIDDSEIQAQDESQDETDFNEYESEGIDESGMEERSDSSLDGVVSAGHSGRFSSPELSDDDAVEDVAPMPILRKRRIVSDSEDEEPQTRRVRRRTVVDLDDDDQDEHTQDRPSDTSVAVSDDEDEEPQTRRVRRRTMVNLDDDDQDEHTQDGPSDTSVAISDDEDEDRGISQQGKGNKGMVVDVDDEDEGVVEIGSRRASTEGNALNSGSERDMWSIDTPTMAMTPGFEQSDMVDVGSKTRCRIANHL